MNTKRGLVVPAGGVLGVALPVCGSTFHTIAAAAPR